MILLDENIPESQRLLLRSWRVPVRQIGFDAGSKGMKDDAIIPFLHQLRRSTWFTRDLGFHTRRLAHANYCLVCLDVRPHEAASFVRRVLRHPEFAAVRKRMGKVVRVSHVGLRVWQLRKEEEAVVGWAARG